MNNTIYIGRFSSKSVALEVLRRTKEIAECYGYATVADVKDFYGDDSTWYENNIGWTAESLKCVLIEQVDPSTYSICMPEYTWVNSNSKSIVPDKKKRSQTGEPINITISSGEWDTRRNDIEDALQVLFKNSEKIKDRPVFITIM